MTILESDIKLLASERMTDEVDGGGLMSAVVIPDNVENNLFPDVSDADRTFGRVQLRKVYCAVTSENRDEFLGAHAIIDDVPSDPACSALMVSRSGYSALRADIVAGFAQSGYQIAYAETPMFPGTGMPQPPVIVTAVAAYRIANGPYDELDDTIDLGAFGPSAVTYWNGTSYVTKYNYERLRPGSVLGLISVSAYPDGTVTPGMLAIRMVKEVTLNAGANTFWKPHAGSTPNYFYNPIGQSVGSVTVPAGSGVRIKFTRPLGRDFVGGGASGQATYDYAVELRQTSVGGTTSGLAFFGQTTTTAALEPGDTVLPVVSAWAQFIPVAEGGEYPTVDPATLGVAPAPYLATGGQVPIFFPNQALVIHHTAAEAPAVAAVGTITLPRDRLAKVQVIGNDGNAITAGWTANLEAGTVTFTSVAGYSQPVTIKHRVEDMLLVSEAVETELKTARGVTHDFPSGSKVSSVLMFGDLRAKVGAGFPQATWTGVFSDTLIGSSPSADFNEAVNPITINNKGGITERWAVIFTNSTSFRVVGEEVGEVVAASSGNTGANCAPINPATGAPYFTIPSAGWGTGWAAGSVYRFNTEGANAPIWLIRSIDPSDPFDGQDKFTVALRGNIDA